MPPGPFWGLFWAFSRLLDLFPASLFWICVFLRPRASFRPFVGFWALLFMSFWPFCGLLGLFWASSRLLGLFPTFSGSGAFSGPFELVGLTGFFWAAGPLPALGPVGPFLSFSQPFLGLGPPSRPFLGPRASSGPFVGLFPAFSGPRNFFWAF